MKSIFITIVCLFIRLVGHAQTYSDLTNNVDTIYSGGAAGNMFLCSNQVIPITTSNPLLGQEVKLHSVATEYSAGRVVGISHEGLIIDGNIQVYDNIQFLSDVVKWLSQGGTNVKFKNGWASISNTGTFQNALQGDGFAFSSLPSPIDSSSLVNTDVIIFGNDWNGDKPYTAKELALIEGFVSAGGGVLILGLGWSWLPKPFDDYPMNNVAELFGFRYIDGFLHDPVANLNGFPLIYNLYPNLMAVPSFDLCGLDVESACQYLNTYSQTYGADLADTLQNNANIRLGLQSSLIHLADQLKTLNATDPKRTEIYTCATSVCRAYPQLWQKGLIYDKVNQTAMGFAREKLSRILYDALPLTDSIKADIALTLQFSGLYLDIWNDFEVMLLDNSSLDSAQLAFTHAILEQIPKELLKLTVISFRDFIGNTNDLSFVGVPYSVNSFSDRINGVQENQFPNDVMAESIPIFCAALSHEINHIVDAFYVNTNPYLTNRKSQLLAQASDDPLEYLRNPIPDDFFLQAPQEFVASISNQWFADSKKTFELGVSRFNNHYKEPINQFIYFADIYSMGGDSTIFYKNVDGNLTSFKVPIARNSQGFIEEIVICDTTYIFGLDSIGNVTSISNKSTTQAEVTSLHKVLSIFPNPTSGMLSIEFSSSGKVPDYQIEIHHASGKLVYTGRNESMIDLSDRSPGIYIVKIQSETLFYSTKIWLTE